MSSNNSKRRSKSENEEYTTTTTTNTTTTTTSSSSSSSASSQQQQSSQSSSTRELRSNQDLSHLRSPGVLYARTLEHLLKNPPTTNPNPRRQKKSPLVNPATSTEPNLNPKPRNSTLLPFTTTLTEDEEEYVDSIEISDSEQYQDSGYFSKGEFLFPQLSYYRRDKKSEEQALAQRRLSESLIDFDSSFNTITATTLDGTLFLSSLELTVEDNQQKSNSNSNPSSSLNSNPNIENPEVNSTEEREIPLGEEEDLKAKGIPATGTENYGGPVVTAGGLVFIGASKDGKLRAFNKFTGKLLWQYDLPAPGFATPSIYELNGKQFLVIACGGGKLGAKSSDNYVAFALD